ncbi:MAG: hypothetical protein H7843_16275, partial [Nitrospirota bacterium]
REKANAVEVQEDGNPLNNETGSIDMGKRGAGSRKSTWNGNECSGNDYEGSSIGIGEDSAGDIE